MKNVYKYVFIFIYLVSGELAGCLKGSRADSLRLFICGFFKVWLGSGQEGLSYLVPSAGFESGKVRSGEKLVLS